MGKFREEFCETYGSTASVKKHTRDMLRRRKINEEMKLADRNITKVTQGKLGRTL